MLMNKRSTIKKSLLFFWIFLFLVSVRLWIKYLHKTGSVFKFQEDGRNILQNKCERNDILLGKWKTIYTTSKDLNHTLKDLEKSSSYRKLDNGLWVPYNCSALSTVAIIIPYRDRQEHLKQLLVNVHNMLRLQFAAYGIYVVEQMPSKKINRGTLRNIGFVESSKHYKFDCFIFHDVDLIPENATNIYSCFNQPLHLSSAVDSFNYRIPYIEIFGGVIALSKKQFETVNGYSNRFFHWGGEDDDLYGRLYVNGFKRKRSNMLSGRYRMLHHHKSERNPYRFLLGWHDIKSGIWRKDGLNNLKYTTVKSQKNALYDWICVNFDDSQADFFIKEAIGEIRSQLPPRYRSINDTQISGAVIQLKQYFRGPYQVLNAIQNGVKATNPFT